MKKNELLKMLKAPPHCEWFNTRINGTVSVERDSGDMCWCTLSELWPYRRSRLYCACVAMAFWLKEHGRCYDAHETKNEQDAIQQIELWREFGGIDK